MDQANSNTDSADIADTISVQKNSMRIAFIYGVLAGVIGLGAIWAICSWVRLEQLAEYDGKNGYVIRDAKLNDILEWLAKKEKLQYFHNPDLDTSDYIIDGFMNPIVNPMNEINDLALSFNLKVKIVGDTLYILTAEQLAREPWNTEE